MKSSENILAVVESEFQERFSSTGAAIPLKHEGVLVAFRCLNCQVRMGKQCEDIQEGLTSALGVAATDSSSQRVSYGV